MSFLNNENIEKFHKNGYVILKNVFNNEELLHFEQSLLSLIKITLKKASEKYDHINLNELDGNEFDDGIIKLEEIDTDYIADIYDTIPNMPSFMRLTGKHEISKFVNMIFKKNQHHPLYTFTNRCRIDPPRNTRRSVDWHQEIFYTIPQSEFVQTWGPLVNDIKKENGTIEICVGSHKEEIAQQSYDKEENIAAPFVLDPSLIEKYKKVSIEMKLGDLMVFSPKLFHRSGSNVSKHVRYTTIGMFHNTEFSTFRPPKPNFTYKESSPLEYYNEFFKKSN